MTSFLEAIPPFLKRIPDSRLDGQKIVDELSVKCRVLYYAMDLPSVGRFGGAEREGILYIVWPHRWEHDKDPQTFFEVLLELKSEGYRFKVAVLGEQYEARPEVFKNAASALSDCITAWGYQESKEKYYQILASAHVVVSTAKHEFFGVAMLEAVHLGCYPLAPNALVYPEHFPDECLYNTKAQLAKKLRYFCRYPEKTRYLNVDVSKYSWLNLKAQYEEVLGLH